MARKKRKGVKKRTISPEQQAKMQEGRKRAQKHRERVEEMRSHGIRDVDTRSPYERMIDNARRK